MLWQLVYWACVALVLVPTPLLEFRYFTVYACYQLAPLCFVLICCRACCWLWWSHRPFLLAQMHEHSSSASRLFANVIANLVRSSQFWRCLAWLRWCIFHTTSCSCLDGADC